MTDPIIGSADDYLVRVLTELGSEIQQSTLSHIAIDERKLVDEARDLPALIFYYSAVLQRMLLKLEQLEIEQDTSEARAYLTTLDDFKARGIKVTVDEIKARVTLSDNIVALRKKIAEIRTHSQTIKGVLESLRQKGYSLQLVAGIRGKEEDWLRRSFLGRYENHPNKDRILTAFKQVIGDT